MLELFMKWYKSQASAVLPDDLSAPSWNLRPLKSDIKGYWALTVNGNWRVVFTFEGEDAVLKDYLDYR